MFGLMKKAKQNVTDISTYLEILGDNRIAYRVTTGTLCDFSYPVTTYGIETEDMMNGDKQTIADFSRNIEDAVDFAEMLITNKLKPNQMYNMALNYLCSAL